MFGILHSPVDIYTRVCQNLHERSVAGGERVSTLDRQTETNREVYINKYISSGKVCSRSYILPWIYTQEYVRSHTREALPEEKE